MPFFSDQAMVDAAGELISVFWYLITPSLPERTITTLVPGTDHEGGLSVSFVELPESQTDAFLKVFDANRHSDDALIASMGGTRRVLGTIDKKAGAEEIKEQLKNMLLAELHRRAVENPTDHGIDNETLAEDIRGSVDETAAESMKFIAKME